MKNILLSCCLIVSFFADAQMKEGRVVYERTMQMPVRSFGNNPDAPQIPRTRTDQYELLFISNQSLWQFLPNATDENPGEFSGGGMVMRFGGTNDITYHNFEKAQRVDQREIMDKSFVVTDSIRKLAWKLTDETKTILTYAARKATAQNVRMRMNMSMENGVMKREQVPDTVQVVAWFTTDIPVPAGPEFGGQLPGLILELSSGNGQMVYKVLEVSPKVSVNKIKEPKDGKKLTAAEFVKERDKLMDEMRRNMPGGDNIRIIQQ